MTENYRLKNLFLEPIVLQLFFFSVFPDELVSIKCLLRVLMASCGSMMVSEGIKVGCLTYPWSSSLIPIVFTSTNKCFKIQASVISTSNEGWLRKCYGNRRNALVISIRNQEWLRECYGNRRTLRNVSLSNFRFPHLNVSQPLLAFFIHDSLDNLSLNAWNQS